MEVPSLGEFAEEDWRKPEKGFASMIRNIDRDMGKLLAKLRDVGIDDHTIVFFSSDNGPYQEGGHQMPFFDSNGDLLDLSNDPSESTDGGTTCFITQSVSEEIQNRGVFLAHASGYEGRMHASQPNVNGTAFGTNERLWGPTLRKLSYRTRMRRSIAAEFRMTEIL